MHYSFHSTPTYTFKSRTENVTKHNQPSAMPGPADYQVKKPLHQTATVAQTTQQRNLYKPFEPNPGPGAYQSKSYIADGPKRSISARYIDYNKHTPGPQDYQTNATKLLNKAPRFSLGNKSKSSKQIIFDHNTYKPASTNYETKGTFNSAHGVVIGSSKRKDLTETEKTPAPNFYQSATAADFADVANPRCIIGSQFRKTEFNQGQHTPGPAFYNKSTFIEENASKKRGFSCRQKVTDLIAQELSKFPAPGQYESHLKNKSTAPRCTTTHTKRKTFMDDMQNFKKQYPGPGYHQPQIKRALSANLFSRSLRKPLDQNEKTPGPVQYNSSRINLMNAAPVYSSTKTVAKNQFLAVNPQNPGPGQYDPKITLVKRRESISQIPKQKRPDFEHHRHTPGPGFYNLRGKQQGPTWVFPNQRRISFTDLKNEAKNGTHYELKSKVVDPPSYMRVDSKLKFSPNKSALAQTGFSNR